MDKARANFDSENASKDEHGNITAKNQSGVTAEIVGGDKNGLVVNIKPRKSAKDAKLDAMEKDMLVRRDKNT